MRSMGKLALLVCLLMRGAAYADSCAAGSVNSVLGTTCAIGNLNFQFYSLDPYGGNNGDDLHIAPFIDGSNLGFTLTGAVPTTAPADGYSFDSANLYFNVFGIGSTQIYGMGGSMNGSTSPGTGYGYASAYFQACDVGIQVCFTGFNSRLECPTCTIDAGHPQLGFVPMSETGAGWAQIYTEGFHGGSGSVSSATYWFNTAWVDDSGAFYEKYCTTVPEPSSILLLGSGLVGAVARWRRKVAA